MKRIRTALCLILAAALLAGCAFLPSDSEPETPAPTDPLTGLALEWQGQRPVAVAIENTVNVRPKGLKGGILHDVHSRNFS